ncbi:MAG: antibiotic biosynthesis monooxygenase [Desulfocapsaceae bacterium]
MVLLLIKIDFKDDSLGGHLFRIDEHLDSLHVQEGYCTHSVNRHLQTQKQWMLAIEWKNEAAAKNYLQTKEFKLLEKAVEKVGAIYAVSLAGVLTRGGVDSLKEQHSSPLFKVPSE